ncbi:lectin BRA-3-like isoform X2 [Ptychodera flava]|uniref:lectin BRA-3-like isoform X2 n=2 Tax=Ptychodera flava TaxID=63121 RepID=UPI00396A5DBE
MTFKLAVIFFACVAMCYAQSPAGNFTLESCEKGDCDCTVYVFYCQQDSTVHPYQPKAAELCSTLSVLPGGPSGRLASLRTPRIDSEVRNYITTHGLDGSSCITRFGFWIGLSDGLVEGEYVWSDGGALCPHDFRNWAPREPNNNTKQNPDGQDCVQLWFRGSRNGLWDDEYCDYRPKGIVCEIPDPHCHSLP